MRRSSQGNACNAARAFIKQKHAEAVARGAALQRHGARAAAPARHGGGRGRATLPGRRDLPAAPPRCGVAHADRGPERRMDSLDSLRWGRARCACGQPTWCQAHMHAAALTLRLRLRSGGEIAAQLVQDSAGMAAVQETPRLEALPPSAETTASADASPQERRCRVPGCAASLESRYSIRTRCAQVAQQKRPSVLTGQLPSRNCQVMRRPHAR